MLVLRFDLVVTWCFIWYYFCLGWLTWLVGFGNRGVVRGGGLLALLLVATCCLCLAFMLWVDCCLLCSGVVGCGGHDVVVG